MSNITLDAQTQRLVIDAAAALNHASVDELVCDAVRAYLAQCGLPTDAELDAALDAADHEIGVPWHQAPRGLLDQLGGQGLHS